MIPPIALGLLSKIPHSCIVCSGVLSLPHTDTGGSGLGRQSPGRRTRLTDPVHEVGIHLDVTLRIGVGRVTPIILRSGNRSNGFGVARGSQAKADRPSGRTDVFRSRASFSATFPARRAGKRNLVLADEVAGAAATNDDLPRADFAYDGFCTCRRTEVDGQLKTEREVLLQFSAATVVGGSGSELEAPESDGIVGILNGRGCSMAVW